MASSLGSHLTVSFARHPNNVLLPTTEEKIVKSAAMTLSALKHSVVLITLVLVGFLCHWLWMPLFYAYVGIVSLNFLNVIIQLVGGALFKGLSVTRAELAAAMQELREEDAAKDAAAKERIEVNKAKLREEKLHGELIAEQAKSWGDGPCVEGSSDSLDKPKPCQSPNCISLNPYFNEFKPEAKPKLELVPPPEPEDEDFDEEGRPKLRVINGDKE